tara:strand:- start:339 stop:575 length:237 start_codon:yes stop_codon:yes gene_type:complete
MKRLTIHLTNAPFVTREQRTVTDSSGNKISKPKKARCINNTMSYIVKDKEDALATMSSLESSFGHSTKISKWYISNIN